MTAALDIRLKKFMSKVELSKALLIANEVKRLLSPHCERIEIAGSIRRKKKEVGDIEIVAIPKPYDTGLFESGIATVVNRWQKIKGDLPCKYTQRLLPEGIKLDLFFAIQDNRGLILAIRTGSASFSHKVLATGWKERGYKSINGMLHFEGKPIPIRTEQELFQRLNMKVVPPEKRN